MHSASNMLKIFHSATVCSSQGMETVAYSSRVMLMELSGEHYNEQHGVTTTISLIGLQVQLLQAADSKLGS